MSALEQLFRRTGAEDPVLVLSVVGRPQPAGSKKGFVNRRTGRVIITDDAKKSKPWKQEVAGAAAALLGDQEPELGPLYLELTFFLARPKGHFGTGRNAGTLKASAPAHPTVKPDTTKLVRAVEDALTGLAWRDDAQVVDQLARKKYGSPERCEIRVERL